MWRIPLFKGHEALRAAPARYRSGAALREAVVLAGDNMEMVAALYRLDAAAEWAGATRMIFASRVASGPRS